MYVDTGRRPYDRTALVEARDAWDYPIRNFLGQKVTTFFDANFQMPVGTVIQSSATTSHISSGAADAVTGLSASEYAALYGANGRPGAGASALLGSGIMGSTFTPTEGSYFDWRPPVPAAEMAGLSRRVVALAVVLGSGTSLESFNTPSDPTAADWHYALRSRFCDAMYVATGACDTTRVRCLLCAVQFKTVVSTASSIASDSSSCPWGESDV